MMLTSDAVQSRQHAIWYYKGGFRFEPRPKFRNILMVSFDLPGFFLDSFFRKNYFHILCSSNKLRFVMFCDDEIVLVLVLVLALT